jgi:hypothetical protein
VSRFSLAISQLINISNPMKNHRSLLLIGLLGAVLAAPFARAITFTLDASTATIVPGNIVSTFYEATSASDSGTMAPTFTFTYSGTGAVAAADPFKIEIFFNGPQPVLTSAFWKAGNDYMLWDSTDLAPFNAGIYTSLTLVGNGLLNPPQNAYLGLSHAGLVGTAGPGSSTGVPDSGSTALMLGLGLVTLVAALRRRS